MKWSDLKGYVGKFAPWIAASFGGPAAGMGVKALCGALGLDESNVKPEDIDAMFKSGQLTSGHFLALRTAEQKFQVQMETLQVNSIKDLEALAVEDRKSAREREIAVNDKTPAIGFYVTSIGFFGLLGVLMFHQAPEGSRDLLNIMLGALGLAWGNQVKYYYGGSAGDERVNEMLHNSTPKKGGSK